MEKINFNQGWTFYKDGQPGTSQVLDLPHDAMLHEQRDPDSPGTSAIAFFPGGKYVYEKTFAVPTEWQERVVTFEFEGVYKNSTVYINDREAGGWPYGYSRFFVTADAFLQYGAQNTIKVIADNSRIPNSRWYSGSGIYRPVHLVITNKTHIELDGVKVSTLSYTPARILVETKANGGEVQVDILDGDRVVASGSGASVEFEIADARLWSADEPNLYHCHVTLTEDGQVVDEVTEQFGIRKVEWSNKGLFINGRNTLLRGGCIHHDNGILGACAYDQAEERRVRIMKQAGFNAIRSSHNPTSHALLEACDRLGMYVMDETFDMWYQRKTTHDYAKDFDQWHKEDIRAMVERDFNHPSVILYSIGNEVGEPAQERGLQLTREMVDYIHSLDRNRAVTGGMNLMIINMASKGRSFFSNKEGEMTIEKKPSRKKKQQASSSLLFNLVVSIVGPAMSKAANSKKADRVTSPSLDLLDIAGYNYASGRYPIEGNRHPERVVLGSETFPFDIAKNWAMVKKYPYLVGDFMWTGWDYLGEAGIGSWSYTGGGFFKSFPWLLSDTGAIDILGNIGAEAKYAATVWGLEDKPYIGVRPVNNPGKRPSKSMWRGTNAIDSWSWKNCEGNPAEIEVYADAAEVELLINGKSLGKKKIKEFKAMFKAKYAPGTLKAVAYDQSGKKLSENELVSAIGKTEIALTSEETELKAGRIAYVHVDLVGENGEIERNADRKLSVTVQGGKLLGFGSANPCTEEGYVNGSHTTYYGRALAVVKAEKAGIVTLQVAGEGLQTTELNLKVIN